MRRQYSSLSSLNPNLAKYFLSLGMYFTSSIGVRINVSMHSYLDHPACSIFAHRGGSIESYENTIESFNYAVDLGWEYIETDVQLSSDGVPYIFHDDDLHRFIGKKLRFNDLNSNELNKIKLFDRFLIPTLKECMEAFPNTKFNIDLKTNEVMGPAMKYLHSINAHSRVCIASFSDQRLDFVKKNYPKFCRSMGPSEILSLKLNSLGLKKFLPEADCVQIPIYKYGIKLATKKLIETAHRLNLKVHVWTINDAATMDRLIDLGVDGIITDKPNLLKERIAAKK